MISRTNKIILLLFIVVFDVQVPARVKGLNAHTGAWQSNAWVWGFYP